jgi:predicted amidophosphoribosyltransferase
MNKEQIESETNSVTAEELCSVCNSDPVVIDEMCQFCYEEILEDDFQEVPKEVMPKHGQNIRANPGLQRERTMKKSIKINRRR